MSSDYSPYHEGSDAYLEGIPIDMNPYDNSDEYDRSEWIYGWTTEFEIDKETWEDEDEDEEDFE